MKNHLLRIITTIACVCLLHSGFAQDRLQALQAQLDTIALQVPSLNEKVELSVSGVSVHEFLRALAVAHNLNITVDAALKEKVVNNFSNVAVKDVILFLCKNYQLQVDFTGNIMAISGYSGKPKSVQAKKLKINYNNQTDFLSLDLRRDTLESVARELTKRSFKNVVIAPGIGNTPVSVFIQNRPFDDALDKLAFANGLTMNKTDNNFYLIEKKEVKPKTRSTQSSRGKSKARSGKLTVSSSADESLTVQAENVAVSDILAEVSAELFKNYFFYSIPDESVTLYVENVNYEDFLNYVLNGTEFTFKEQDEVYLFGERNLEGLRTTELVQLQNRTIENVVKVIPPDLKQGVSIQEFMELNSLILSGSRPRIREIKEFVTSIDQVVPSILIEVIIADIKKTRTRSTGISAGLGDSPATTKGTLYPSVDMTYSSKAINEIVDKINGFGLVKLGKVTPNFYLSLKALEEEGILKMRSTPQIATMNGHEATLSIGNQEHYLEETSNVYASQITQNVITRQYRSVRADFSITIKPIVSGDEQITLEISVDQSDFTARIAPDAPPGSVSRNFKSMIRVKNEEMVLIGGLEEKSNNNTGSGIPFLSTVPILKWFFSDRTQERKKSKLSIFIKPTVIY